MSLFKVFAEPALRLLAALARHMKSVSAILTKAARVCPEPTFPAPRVLEEVRAGSSGR